MSENETVRKVFCGRYTIDNTLNGKIIEYNDNFCALTGYTKEQLDSGEIDFFSLVPPEDFELYMQKVAMVADDGGGILEHRLVKADGGLLSVICIAETYVNDEGHNCASITISDIGKRLLLEQDYIRTRKEIEALIDYMPGAIVVLKITENGLRVVKAGQKYYEIIGDDPDSPSDIFKDFFTEEQGAALKAVIEKCVNTKLTFDRDLRLKRSGRWIKLKGRYYGKDTDGADMLYCSAEDITEAKRRHKKLVQQNLCFRMIAENTDETFFEYENETDIFTSTSHKLKDLYHSNGVFSRFIEMHRAEEFIHPDDIEAYDKTWSDAIAKPCKGTLDYRTKAYDKDYKWYRMIYVSIGNAKGEVTNVYGMIRSIDHIKIMKTKLADDRKEIERLSNTDHVTGLLNRNTFKLTAAKMLRELYNDSMCYAIVYSDINDFSYINENFGYDAGNGMLNDFANIIRDLDSLVCGCRIYSDYFVGLYRERTRDKLISVIAERNKSFTTAQRAKYPMSDTQISSGIYFIRSAEEDITIAMDNANLARRSVKGRSDIPGGVYTDRMRKKRSHDQTIASEVWNAMTSGAIELFLQPKFDLKTREIIGAEALTRWRNPDGSYKLPFEFIDVLENVGYITHLDMYIYEQVLKCLARWKMEGKRLIPISVNFSRKHNNDPDFVMKVSKLAEFYCVDKNLIEIEITESCFTQDVKNLFTNMKKLRENGFKIDIDDFGTGYSSLSVLLEAPVDIVKVDKVFIDDISDSERSREYIDRICSLIQTTRKDIIFEGVETEEQAQILAKSGHSMAQGWLFDKAISVDEFNRKYMK